MKKLSFIKSDLLVLSLLSILIGVVVGAVDTIFGKILLFVSDFRVEHFIYLIFFLGPVGMLFTYFLLKYGKSSSQGMGLIFRTGLKEKISIPKRLPAFVMVGTWLTHLFGGSAGREGVAIQVGASISVMAKPLMKKMDTSLFVIIGMAAGFSGLFGIPIAASFFAVEVLTVGSLRYDALVPALFAAFSANATSSWLDLEKFSANLTTLPKLNLDLFIKLILLGLLFGICGGLFSKALNEMKKLLNKKMPNPLRRIGLVGIVLSLVLWLLFSGRYAGLGTNLITASFSQAKILPYDWFFKAVLTVLTVAAGFQGGEVTPLFATGATLGVAVSGVLGLPASFAAALGYAAVFGSATNTFLAPMMIGAEVFGFESLPYFFIVASIAFVCNGNQSIYGNQKIAEFLD